MRYPQIVDTIEGIESRCEKIPEAGCWIWMGRTNMQGYGTLHKTDRRSAISVHRLMYALANGIPAAFLPADLCVRHRCDTPTCVNPDHLTIGTWKDNIHDAAQRGRHAVAFQEIDGKVVGSCRNGHDLATAGIYDYGIVSSGYRLRVCLECKRANSRNWYRRKHNSTGRAA